MKYILGQEVRTTRPFRIQVPTVNGSLLIPENSKAEICGISESATKEITRLWLRFPVSSVIEATTGSTHLELEVMPQDIKSTLLKRLRAEVLG